MCVNSCCFLVTPSENSPSIKSHLDLLRIDSNPSHDLSRSISCSIMTDEGSALVKVACLGIIIACVHFMSISWLLE